MASDIYGNVYYEGTASIRIYTTIGIGANEPFWLESTWGSTYYAFANHELRPYESFQQEDYVVQATSRMRLQYYWMAPLGCFWYPWDMWTSNTSDPAAAGTFGYVFSSTYIRPEDYQGEYNSSPIELYTKPISETAAFAGYYYYDN